MDDSILLAAATGLSAVLGSLITGLITYRTATDQRALGRHKRRLRRALRDIAALHRLEDRYTNALAATGSRSSEAWKREIRKQLREEGLGTLSSRATTQRAEQDLAELD